jgi:hypothetical protein
MVKRKEYDTLKMWLEWGQEEMKCTYNLCGKNLFESGRLEEPGEHRRITVS